MKRLFMMSLVVILAMSLFADTRRIYCQMEHQWWYADGAGVAAHYWGGAGGTTWPGERMTQVEGTTDMWYIDVDESHTNIIFVRVPGSGEMADWGAKTQDLTIPTDGNNLFTISNAQQTWGDPGCTGTWSFYENAEPTLWLDVASYAFLGETITLTARSENVTDPVYTYYVKTPDAADFVVMEGTTYKPEAAGTYTFRVTVAAGAVATEVLAEVEKTVAVRELPEPITIKVKVPAEWGTTISLWCWDDYNTGMWVSTTAEGEWYIATLERLYPASFIVVNGTGWSATGDNSQQTVDVANITASGCYEVGAVSTDEANQGKREVTTIDCGDEPGSGTGMAAIESSVQAWANGQDIQAVFDGVQRVQVYTVSGQLLHEIQAKGTFSYPATRGLYLLRIGGDTYKVAVK